MLPKKIRIYNTPWHVAHQYELYKIPNTEWYHQINVIRKWSARQFRSTPRPRPKNLFDVSHYEKGKYDLAVLHIDQQCIDPTLGKSKLYRELNSIITDIPKIVIQHGTPFWPECYSEAELKMKMRVLIGNNYMVCNSDEAQRMWGDMGKGTRTIIHGLDQDEWWDLDKEPRVVTMLSPAGLEKYYNRQLLIAVKEKLRARAIQHAWIQVDFMADNFSEYRSFLGRSLLYFNPTLQSPMPRSRTEAMLSGCCVITLANHGAEKFIKNGVNGFTVPNNPQYVADLITKLMEPEMIPLVKQIGQRGKQTAIELFGKERFQKDWEDLITKVLDL